MQAVEDPYIDRSKADDLDRSRLELLLRLLAESAAPTTLTAGDWHQIVAAGVTTGLLPDLVQKLRRDDAAALTPERIGRDTARHIDDLVAGYGYRREYLRQGLTDLTRHWNAAGLDPILISGAREVWLRKPWSYGLNELGILVEPHLNATAADSLRQQAFTRAPARLAHQFRHESIWSHRRNICVRLCTLGFPRRLDRLLPTDLLLEESQPTTVEGIVVRLLPDWLDVVHAMVSQQVSSRRSASPHALYCFAAAMRGLGGDDRERLRRFLDRNPAITAIHTAWVEAARMCQWEVYSEASTEAKSSASPETGVRLVKDRSGWRIALRPSSDAWTAVARLPDRVIEAVKHRLRRSP